ncbi:hypothetical protein BB559_003804 [Furculomyces boomerangus]|uniref:Condensin complex subunit 2 n=1 Tax=Furculomyces boomerangus TaxID=61424 RepID=A0A2T9YIS2_9FUNG|nr:hypothetical protein BB559_003804 [Furculomyces boomerangus]
MSLKTPLVKKRNVSSIVTPKPNKPITVTATPNDDAKERRLRRKSAMERRRSELTTPKLHNIAASVKALNRVEDGEFADYLSDSQLDPPSIQVPQLSSEELNRRFEEWMKIAADNKINMHNTWDFALIDYFYDMRLLKDGGTINFQKASCTLDGCVKIYSSRVDSVATETGKLLTGLAEAPSRKSKYNTDNMDEDIDEEKSTRKSKKRGKLASNTLAPDFTSITLKKFDLELSVDPLFKKASADFDEGGASGLLLNNLDIDNKGKILFDSGNSLDLSLIKVDSLTEPKIEDCDVDISENKIFDQSIFDMLVDASEKMEGRQVNVFLADYVLEKDSSVDLDALLTQVHSYDDRIYESENESDDNEITLDPNADDTNKIDSFLDFGENDFEGPVPESTDLDQITGVRKQITEESELSNVPPTLGFDLSGENDFFSYFDSNSTKSWAGPEHWKIPVLKSSGKKGINTNDTTNHLKSAMKPKKQKVQFFIDFDADSKDASQSIYEKPTKLSSLEISKATLASKNTHTLPEDMQFNSKKMFSLFLKPTVEFRAHRSKTVKVTSLQSAIPNNPTEAGIFAVNGQGNTLYFFIFNLVLI